MNIESLYFIPETNIMCVKYTSVENTKIFKKEDPKIIIYDNL